MSNLNGKYDDQVVRYFTLAALFWGVVGIAAGVFIALQMAYPVLNFDLPWTTFGRLRPLHTSGVIFAFGGNVLMATSLFVVQRTCAVKLPDPLLARFVFIGYQFFIVIAALGYIFGVTQGREYAEPEWYADLWLTIVWVVYLYIFLRTIVQRTEPHIYVANWFYLAFIIVIAVLHVGNNLSIPVSFFGTESVAAFSGVQSAMIQWWYGHNAVGFLLTAGFIGILYYFVPKRANRPVYSYRLSILHFWGLVFLYIWAGPHHLMYTSLPDWVQSLGMTMSIILWLPSWGGMLNGIMTLSGAWDKLRDDPVLKFFVTSLAFYGMSTFEGPLMSIKSVNALSHYTEWTISHVHSGALGWVAMISFGALYHMVPILWRKPSMHSVGLVTVHFWLATAGIVLYVASMWTAGITQGLMWRNYDAMGFLKYSFLQTVIAMHPYYVVRAIGGIFFLSGILLMLYNVLCTVRHIRKENIAQSPEQVQLSVKQWRNMGENNYHSKIEQNLFYLLVLIILVASVGGMMQVLPLFKKEIAIEVVDAPRPYTPLELAGFEIYKREGCYGCHSQQIRMLRDEVERYGHYSIAAESIYDYPFAWGSKRTGPDLARVGEKYSDDWHVQHLHNPRSLIPESIMPGYPFILAAPLDISGIQKKMKILKTLGVPYSDDDIAHCDEDIQTQLAFNESAQIQEAFKMRYPGAKIRKFNKRSESVTEMDALVAYIQGLGNKINLVTNKGRKWQN